MTTRHVILLGLVAVAAACGEATTPPPAAGILHVPEGYHVARFTPGHRQHLALTGDKATACRDCHDLRKQGFVSPGEAVCRKCHAAQEKQHHPLDAGAPLTCFTCHAFTATSAAATRFDRWKCVSCHREAQGARQAITVHRDECAACHRPHTDPFTVAADCTTCHEVSLLHGAKGETLADTCMACHKHHTPAAEASAQCLACHEKATVKAAARVKPAALFSPGHRGCGTCHQPHTFVKGALHSCEKCHANKPLLAPLYHTACVDCHQPHQARSAAVSCEGCHKDQVVKHPKDPAQGSCRGCHPPHPKKDTGMSARECVECHDKAPFNAKAVHAEDALCSECHQPHAGKPAKLALCGTCHEEQVTATKANKEHAKCDACHAGLPHGVKGETKPCLACHEKQQAAQAGHRKDGCGSCHATHSGAVLKACASCHVGGEKALPGLHAVKEHQDCKACHAAHEPQPGFGPKGCQTCHKRLTLKAHPTAPVQCVGCHLFKDAVPGTP